MCIPSRDCSVQVHMNPYQEFYRESSPFWEVARSLGTPASPESGTKVIIPIIHVELRLPTITLYMWNAPALKFSGLRINDYPYRKTL